MSPAETRVQVATPEQRTHVAALRRAWAEEQAGAEISDPSFDHRFEEWSAREADQRVTWLAWVGDEPVGMLNLLVFTRMPRPQSPEDDRPGQWGYVANVYVRPEHRGAGSGGLLVAAATSYADARGFARIVLAPSPRSVPLYRRAGFGPATQLMVRERPAT